MTCADTIYALSSGALPSAIAIVRISGPQAAVALGALAGSLPAPRHATLRTLRDEDGATLDHALVLWLPGPRTATGDDLAELHLHGSRAVLRAVFGMLARQPDVRLAEPGEFTRRAVINGRMHLHEAEGLADLIEAETEDQRRLAIARWDGGVEAAIVAWRDRLLDLAARAEVAIDYDEEADAAADPTLPHDVAALARELADATATPPAERLRDGFRVLVAGPPNAGKSSLINALSRRDAVIVTDEAGTTRDLVELPLRIEDVALTLIDSAGLRETSSKAEQVGIDRATVAIGDADLVVWLGDPADAPRTASALLILHSRCDLPERASCPQAAAFAISTVNGRGLERLRTTLLDHARSARPHSDKVILAARYWTAVHRCAELLTVGATADLILLAEHLRLARETLDRVIGAAGTEEMLDRLFARFCLGK